MAPAPRAKGFLKIKTKEKDMHSEKRNNRHTHTGRKKISRSKDRYLISILTVADWVSPDVMCVCVSSLSFSLPDSNPNWLLLAIFFAHVSLSLFHANYFSKHPLPFFFSFISALHIQDAAAQETQL